MLKIYICEQICKKGSYTCTVSRHTFHHHLLATSMHQQHMCLILLKVEQSAFTQAFFSSMSNIHQCSGRKPWPIMLKLLPIMLLSSAQKCCYYVQYYAHNYCNYATVCIQFYYFNDYISIVRHQTVMVQFYLLCYAAVLSLSTYSIMLMR